MTGRRQPDWRGETRDAAARRGPKRGRLDSSFLDEDQPRGFHEERMRELWREIDRSREQFGLGGERREGSAVPAWSVGWLIESAGNLAEWLKACVSECTLLSGAAGWLRQVPILGRLVELVPVLR